MCLAQSHFWAIALKNTLDLLKKIFLFYNSLRSNCIQIVTAQKSPCFCIHHPSCGECATKQNDVFSLTVGC